MAKHFDYFFSSQNFFFFLFIIFYNIKSIQTERELAVLPFLYLHTRKILKIKNCIKKIDNKKGVEQESQIGGGLGSKNI
jgi:hypothetical protein